MVEPPNQDRDDDYYITRYVDGFVDGDKWVKEEFPSLFQEFTEQLRMFTDVGSSYIDQERTNGQDEMEFIRTKLVEYIERARRFNLRAAAIRNHSGFNSAKQVRYRFGRMGTAVLEAYEIEVEDDETVADFTDMVETAATLIRENPDIYENDYTHVLVDEFQDVTASEVAFIEAIVDACDATLFCVGDDWQSIYGFRGSDVGFFTGFEDRYASVATTTLATNYRCPSPVVEAGRDLMTNSRTDQNEKPVEANEDHNHYDERPTVHELGGELYQYRTPHYVVDLVEEKLADGYAPEEVMLLSRNDAASDYMNAVRYELRNRNISHTTPDDGPDFDGNEDGSGVVTTQSIHSSKGTESAVVILVHATEHMKDGIPEDENVDEALDTAVASTADYYAEERRLFYVALTRAEAEFHAVGKSGHLSRYLEEIKEPYFDVVESDVELLTGTVEGIRETGNRYIATFRCEQFDTLLDIAFLKWEFDTKRVEDVVDQLEEADRVALSNVEDESMSTYPNNFTIHDETVTKVLDEPTAEIESADLSDRFL
jgi:DNA helicase-4